MTNLSSYLMRPKALLLVLTMLALVLAGNARASMPVMPPAGSFEQAIAAADDPVEFLLLLTSGYCNNSISIIFWFIVILSVEARIRMQIWIGMNNLFN